MQSHKIASGSSPTLSTSPCIPRAPPRRIRKKKHQFLQIGLDLGASNTDGYVLVTLSMIPCLKNILDANLIEETLKCVNFYDHRDLSDTDYGALADSSESTATSSSMICSLTSGSLNETWQIDVPVPQRGPADFLNGYSTFSETSSDSFTLLEQFVGRKGKGKPKKNKTLLRQVVKVCC